MVRANKGFAYDPQNKLDRTGKTMNQTRTKPEIHPTGPVPGFNLNQNPISRLGRTEPGRC